MDTPNAEGASAESATETVILTATGAEAVLPVADADALLKADLATLPSGSSPQASVWVKLLRDIDGVGRSGKVVQASSARAQPWIAAGDAAAANTAEVSLSAPFHIILED